uniref:Uncharacterized protein n=1 Tax=Anguilla anguilla TaxID=7936 RepID=A0A0E9QVU0_ANGAN
MSFSGSLTAGVKPLVPHYRRKLLIRL